MSLDSITITQGTGTNLGGETIGSAFVQAVKVKPGKYQKDMGDIKRAVIAASSNGVNTIVAAVTAKIIVICSYLITASAAVNAKWQDDTPTDLSGLLYLDTKGGCRDGDPFNGLVETAAGKALILNLASATPVGGYVTYWQF